MKPIEFKEANQYLGAPKGCADVVKTMPVFKHPEQNWLITCWEVSPEEAAEIARTGRLYLHIFGPTTYPVTIDVESPFKDDKKEKESGD